MHKALSCVFRVLTFATLLTPGYAQVEMEKIPDWFPTREFALNYGFTDPKDIQLFRSLVNHSTATSIIPLTIIDPISKERRNRGVHSNFLIGYVARTLHRLESSLSQRLDIAQSLVKSKSFEITMSRKAEQRYFGNPDSKEQYEKATMILSKYSIQELLDLFNTTSPFASELATTLPAKRGTNPQYAIARALFERGLCVGTGCVNNSLWVRQ